MNNYQENNYQKLLNAIEAGVVLTEKEINSLMWLAGREPETVENICSVINKVKRVSEPSVENHRGGV